MDVVELPLPTAVTVSKLLIGEGFGRQGVSVGDAEAQELKANGSVCGRSAVSGDTDSRGAVIGAIPNLEENLVRRTKKADVRFCKLDSSPLVKFGGEDISKQITVKKRNGSPSSQPKCTAKQLHQKSGKTIKSSSPCSKKQKAEQVEGSISQAATEDVHNTSVKHGPHLMRSITTDKAYAVGHKHSIDGKRGDRRHFKAPTKAKSDCFFPKVGSTGTNTAAGGENILGIYGLKSDIHDVTKHVEDLSLDELLDENYKCHMLHHGKAKKSVNTNENLVHMVRNACSIFQTRKAVHQQNTVELDSSSNMKIDACLPSSGSSVTSGTGCSKVDGYLVDLVSSSKGTCGDPGPPMTSSTFTLYEPHDILERLSLPPAKDLDSLLLDTSKPLASSKNSIDLRPSKSFSHGSWLPIFPWSHCSSGPSKTIVDTSRFSANRSTSHGRWARIGSLASSLGDNTSLDLGLLISDQENFTRCSDAMTSHHSLEPKLSLGPLAVNSPKVLESEGTAEHRENDVPFLASVKNLWFKEKEGNYIEQEKCIGRNILDVTASCSHYSPKKCSVGESDEFQSHLRMTDNSSGGYSPRLLAAAQTLHDLSRHTSVQCKSDGKHRCFKRPSQKVTKSSKSGLMTVKSEDTSIALKSEIEHSNPINFSGLINPSKKLKLSTNKKKDGCNNYIGREPMKWSFPTSSRSSPCRTESNSDTKPSIPDNAKLLGMMPPSKRMLDRACNSDQKLRKVVATDWGRGRSKME